MADKLKIGGPRNMQKTQSSTLDPEIAAIAAVYRALEGLTSDSQARVLAYVARKLNIASETVDFGLGERGRPTEETTRTGSEAPPEVRGVTDGGLEGISPVARKWMSRNGIDAKGLLVIFSLGGDEIDLIAKNVPGKSERERMHSVILLKGIAAYLASGAARFTYGQLKEACLHYRAFNSANFASYLKSFASDVSGEKNTGYTLTARGLAAATEKVTTILKAGNAG